MLSSLAAESAEETQRGQPDCLRAVASTSFVAKNDFLAMQVAAMYMIHRAIGYWGK